MLSNIGNQSHHAMVTNINSTVMLRPDNMINGMRNKDNPKLFIANVNAFAMVP